MMVCGSVARCYMARHVANMRHMSYIQRMHGTYEVQLNFILFWIEHFWKEPKLADREDELKMKTLSRNQLRPKNVEEENSAAIAIRHTIACHATKSISSTCRGYDIVYGRLHSCEFVHRSACGTLWAPLNTLWQVVHTYCRNVRRFGSIWTSNSKGLRVLMWRARHLRIEFGKPYEMLLNSEIMMWTLIWESVR